MAASTCNRIEFAPEDIDQSAFWSRVDKDGEDGCWIWTSTLTNGGYGTMWVPAKERSITAHRISSVLAGQDVQPGDHVRHVTCRRRDCVNPDHLEPGSARINAWEVKYDASAPLALHPFNVVEMRYQRAYTSLRLKDMARMFGVSVGACSSVVLHRTWKDIPPVTAGWPEIEQALLMYSYIDADGVQDLKEHVENTYGLSL